MDKQECISQLENLKKHCMDWSPEPPWDKDVKALDMAIEILKKTAQEVPVQEQPRFIPEDSNGINLNTDRCKCTN